MVVVRLAVALKHREALGFELGLGLGVERPRAVPKPLVESRRSTASRIIRTNPNPNAGTHTT